MTGRLARTCIAAALVCLPLSASAAGKLELVAPPLVVISTDTPAATGAIVMRNSGDAAIQPDLVTGTFFTEVGNEPLGITAKFTAVEPIAPGRIVSIPVELSGVTEPGYAKAALYDGSAKLAHDLRVVRKAFAFNVAPVGFDVKQPYVVERAGDRPATVRLINPDPFTHAFEWQVLTRDGVTARGKVPLLRPNGIQEITIPAPANRGVLAWLEGTLQEPRTAATLLLRAVPRGQTGPPEYWTSKEIPLQLQYTAGSRVAREIAQTLLILTLLFLGGLTSLYLTYWVPNTLKRTDVRARIEELTPKIHELRLTPPTLRVLLSVQRNRLREKLKTRQAISLDFLTLAADVEREAEALHKRVAIAQRIENLLLDIEREWETAAVLGPTVLKKALVLLNKAVVELEQGGLTEEDLRSVETHVTAARQLLQPAEEDPKFIAALVARAVKLQDAAAALQPVADTVSDLAPALKVKSANGLVWPDDVWRLDYAVTKMEVAADVPSPAGQQELIDFLRLHSLLAFDEAKRQARQIREQITPATLAAALGAKEQVRIVFHPGQPRRNALVTFELKLIDPKLHAAAARRTFTCRWNFDDGLFEDGWRVSHYFAKPGTYKVSAVVTARDGQKIAIEPEEVIVKEEKNELFGSRTRTEWIRLSVALVVVLLGLLAGAKEQLARLDFVAALMALFLLGVTADQIKNLLAPRTP